MKLTKTNLNSNLDRNNFKLDKYPNEDLNNEIIKYRQDKILKDIKFMRSIIPSIRFFLITTSCITFSFYIFYNNIIYSKNNKWKEYYFKILDIGSKTK